MKKKVSISILSVLSAQFAFADIGYISYSDFSFLVYLYSVLPVILWILNLIVALRTILKKKVNKGLFWFVNCLSILVAFILIYPVSIDISEMGYTAFETYGLTLFILIVLPLTISGIAIRIRCRNSPTNQPTHP